MAGLYAAANKKKKARPEAQAPAPIAAPVQPVTEKRSDWRKMQKGLANATASQAVADVIAADSPLMKLAETEGLQQAGRRGLLSSSMAVGAAQDSVIRAAAPIGMQDAQFKSQGVLDRYAASKQRDLQDDSQKFTGNESRRDRQFTGAQNRLDRQTAAQVARQDRRFQARESQKARLSTKQQNNLDRELQKTLGSWNIDANQQDKASTMLSGFMTTYEQSLAEINSNKNLKGTDREDQIKALQARRERYVGMVRELYAVDISY